MGQLTGGIAHDDFNNLLRVVLGNLELAMPKLEKGSPVLMYIDQAMLGGQARGITRATTADLRTQAAAFPQTARRFGDFG